MERFIDPWSSQQYKDYKRLRDEFGISEFNFELPNPHLLFRRNVVFGHRGFEVVYDAIQHHEKFAVLTGLMPSGKMHLGNKMTIDQVLYYQSLGADVYIAVADLEAFATRNIPLEESMKIAMEEYISNYIALGLKLERTQIYFQSLRKDVTDLGFLFSDKTNGTEMKAIYGFKDETSISHILAPLIQAGDILHIQLDKYSSPLPTIVPVGVDQDPHVRLARELVRRTRFYNMQETEKGLGIFVKKNNDVEFLINSAQELLKDEGFKKFEKNVPYKALYILDAAPKDLLKIEKLLLKVEKQNNGFGFYLPAATYHRLMTSLDGSGKMSSSNPDSYISLDEKPDSVRKKIMNAKTGGGATVEEHRKYGGKPEECPVFEYYLYHLTNDDKYLQEVSQTCRSGTRLCGSCKKEASEKMIQILKELEEKREIAKEKMKEYIRFN